MAVFERSKPPSTMNSLSDAPALSRLFRSFMTPKGFASITKQPALVPFTYWDWRIDRRLDFASWSKF